MSNILSVASAIEKNRIDSGIPFIPMIDVEVMDPRTGALVEIIRYANNPEDIVWKGNVYQAGKFDLQIKNESGAQPEVSLTVNDYTQAIQARMQEFGGGLGFNITLAIVNTDRLNEDAEVVEYFQIVAAESADYKITWKLGAANGLTLTFPRRRQTKDFCQWRFKDPDTCRYTGAATTCDLTLQGPNGCGVKQHTMFFGAMPGINSNGAVY